MESMYLFPFVFVTAHRNFWRVLLSRGSLALQGQRRQDIYLWKGEKVSFIPLMFLDQFRFLGNYPPTPPLSQHFALSEKYVIMLT